MSKYVRYHKVASSKLSLLVAHPRIFRLFMKGNFDAYLCAVTFVQNGPIVDRSTARNFLVGIKYQKRMPLCKTLSWEQTIKATPKIDL